MYQIIYFDLDDTLIDFTGSEKKSLVSLHAKFYNELSYGEFDPLFKDINSNLWKRVGAKEDPLKPSQVRTMRFEQLNRMLGYDNIQPTVIADEYERYLGENADWFPQVKNVIAFLHQKGHILGIITNGLISVQDKKYERLQLSKWFDCFTVSDRVGIAKPNKEIFDTALNEIARKYNKQVEFYNEHSMLMVGDSISSDGHGAKNFGIDFCFINGSNVDTKHSEATITYDIKSVADLPSCIGYKEKYDFF